MPTPTAPRGPGWPLDDPWWSDDATPAAPADVLATLPGPPAQPGRPAPSPARRLIEAVAAMTRAERSELADLLSDPGRSAALWLPDGRGGYTPPRYTNP
jgi:hypothetical protein